MQITRIVRVRDTFSLQLRNHRRAIVTHRRRGQGALEEGSCPRPYDALPLDTGQHHHRRTPRVVRRTILLLRYSHALARPVKRPAVVWALEAAFSHAALTQGCEAMGAAVEGDAPHAAVGLVATAANSTIGLATPVLAVIPPDDKWCA